MTSIHFWLVLMLGVLSVGCKPPSVANPEAAPASYNRKASLFQAIDGTWETEQNRSIIYNMHKAWKNPQSFYQQGVQGLDGGAFARAADTINKEILENLCQKIRSKQARRVFLAGWSRGAIQALGLAIDIQKKNKCGARPDVVWLGLLDAVNTSMYGWDDTVPAGVVAVHIQKNAALMKPLDVLGGGVFTTKLINNVRTSIVWPEALNHAQIGYNRAVMDRFISSARTFGADF